MPYQELTILGNLGGDPEMRYTPNGDPVTSFSVAVSRRYETNGEQREETTWFRCTAWRRTAEIANQYLLKGQQAMVVGTVKLAEWTGQDGQHRAAIEVNVNRLVLLGSGTGGRNPNVPPPPEDTSPQRPGDAEDLPW